MPDGDRVLTEAEWALFRAGLDALWDFIEEDDDPAGLSETGVRVFDVLQPEQKIALLADVAQALLDPTISPPEHTAANEGAIAAVFAIVRMALDTELFEATEGDSPTTMRQLLRAAAAESEDEEIELPTVTEADRDEWEWVLESIEGRIFWDADYEMADEFLDLPPQQAHELHSEMAIDSEYYTAIPREPDRAGLIAARQTLARLLGRPVPDDEGSIRPSWITTTT
jgi:hypothetical protein